MTQQTFDPSTSSTSSPQRRIVDLARIGAGFRTILPPAARQRFQFLEGDDLVVEIDDFGVHYFTFEQVARRSAAIIAGYIDPTRVLSEELIREREEEALRE